MKKLFKKIHKWIDGKNEKRHKKMPKTYLDIYREIKAMVKGYRHKRRVFKQIASVFHPLGYYPKISDQGFYLSLWAEAMDGKDTVSVCREIDNIFKEMGWKYYQKWKYDMGSMDAWYSKGTNSFGVFIAMTDTCEIEEVEETIKKKKVVGLCAKAFEELNN